MNKYKKIMSLLLIVSILLSQLSGIVAFAETVLVEIDGVVYEQEVGEEEAEESEDSEEEGEESEDGEAVDESGENSEAVKDVTELFVEPKLSGVDFVNVYDDSFETVASYLRKFEIFNANDIDPTLVLSRGDFANYIAKILYSKGADAPGSYRYEFKDVEVGTSYYNAVNQLCNYGIIQGDGNGYFYPENDIKGAEATIILLNMMGYYEIAHLMGAGDNGYRKLAIDMDFTDEVPFNYETTVTLEQAAKLIYHALHEKVADSNVYKKGNVEYKQSDETLMYRYMDIVTVEGIVTANEFTSLDSADDCTYENSIKIEDTIVNFADDSLIPYDYLGIYARAYCKNDGDNTALYIEAIDTRYDLLKINAKDVESFDVSSMTLCYTDEKEKIEKEKIPMEISIIFNSVAVDSALDEKYFTPDAGQLVFIDNNRDKKYDVLIIDSYSTYVAKSKLSGEIGTLYDDLGVQNSLSIADKSVKVYKNNQKADYTAISAGDVVFAATEKVLYDTTPELSETITYQKLDVTSKNIRLIASDYEFKGVLESFSDDYIYIDGVEYQYSDSFYISSAIGNSNKTVQSKKLNVSVTGALDLNGDIVWMRRDADVNIKYGYLVKFGYGRGAFQPSFAKIFTDTNEMIAAPFASKVKVHKKWDTGELSPKTYYGVVKDGKTLASDKDVSELEKRQLIKYRLNADGEIAEIFISGDDTGRDYLSTIPTLQDGILYHSTTINHSSTEWRYYMAFGSNGIVGPSFYYKKNETVGFIVPSDHTIEDERYFKAYSPYTDGSPFTHAESITNLHLYDVDASTIGAFLQEKKITISTSDTGSTISSSSTNFISVIVDSVKQVLDPETDEYLTEITAWYKRKLQKFVVANADLVSNENKNIAYLDKIHASKLRRGDILMMRQDSLGYVSGFKILHRPLYLLEEAKKAGTEIAPYEVNFDGTARAKKEVTHAFPTTKMFAAGEVVKMASSVPFVDSGQGVLRRMTMMSADTVQVIIYDMLQDTMTSAVGSTKSPTFSKCEEGDYIFWYQYERYPTAVLVLRNYK